MSPDDDLIQARITVFWSTVASSYEAHGGNVPARESVEYNGWVKAIAELLPPAPADVLDIATGTGFVALIAAGLGHRVTGIDASSAMLDQARAAAGRLGLAVAFSLDDAVEPKLATGSLDAIICRHFIWTLRRPERALGNWRRLLRPGGRVVAIDGFWFDGATAGEDEPAKEAAGLFERHYTKETRAALPAMQLSAVEPVAAMFEAAGFVDVAAGELAAVHALAEHPPSARPWYVIVARRG